MKATAATRKQRAKQIVMDVTFPPAPRGRASLGATLCAALLAGCGAETAGERVIFPVEFAVSPSTNLETASGWTLDIEVAEGSFGPVLLLGGGQRASWWNGIFMSVAYAHPADDTFDKGPVLADVVEQHRVNLLTGTQLGMVEGVAGALGTAEIELHPPGSFEGRVTGPTVRVEGRARRGQQDVPFAFAVDIPEGDQRVVTAVTASGAVQETGYLELRVDLATWLGLVDFSALSAQDELGRFVLLPDGDNEFAFIRGVRAREAFGVSWRL